MAKNFELVDIITRDEPPFGWNGVVSHKGQLYLDSSTGDLWKVREKGRKIGWDRVLTDVTSDQLANILATDGPAKTQLNGTIVAVGDGNYQRTDYLDPKGPGRQSDNLRYFRMGLAKREIEACPIVLTGHSLIEGEGATLRTMRGTDRFRDIMRSRFPVSGAPGGYGFLSVAKLVASWSPDAYVTFGLGAPSSQYGLNGNARFVNASGAYVRLESIMCTAVDVLYVQGGGGSFSTKVDGAANGDSRATTGLPTQIMKYRVPGISGAAAAHTVEVNWISGNSIIAGFVVYNGDETKGINVYNGGWSGVTIGNMLDPSNVKRADVATVAPKLIVVSCLANDFKTGVSIATAKANLGAFLTQLRVKAPSASIVLNVEHQLGSVSSPVAPWADYANIYYEVAEERGDVAVFDFWRRIGPGGPPAAGNAAGMIAVDVQHYTDAGYLMWAESLAEFVSP